MKKVLITILMLLPLILLQGCQATIVKHVPKIANVSGGDPLGLLDDPAKQSFMKIGAHTKTIELNYVMEKVVSNQETMGHFQTICYEIRELLIGRFKDFDNPSPQIQIHFSVREFDGHPTVLDCE
ncbi:MAG: hypothetical protein Q7R35_02270 [Elusimicrobiota bacterium]|nr:hypothetical protein [Elusimicrobiota bacterium]